MIIVQYNEYNIMTFNSDKARLHIQNVLQNESNSYHKMENEKTKFLCESSTIVGEIKRNSYVSSDSNIFERQKRIFHHNTRE